MPDFRSIFRSNVSDENAVRVLGKDGGELLGHLKDVNHKGFRLETKKKFKPGSMLEARFELTADGAGPRYIQVTAQSVWSEGSETGFVIKQIPLAEEDLLDRLIDKVSGVA